MTDNNASNFIEDIRSEVRAAIKKQNYTEIEILQSILARFSNVEAVPVQQDNIMPRGKRPVLVLVSGALRLPEGVL